MEIENNILKGIQVEHVRYAEERKETNYSRLALSELFMPHNSRPTSQGSARINPLSGFTFRNASKIKFPSIFEIIV